MVKLKLPINYFENLPFERWLKTLDFAFFISVYVFINVRIKLAS